MLCYDTASLSFQGGVPADAESILFYTDGLYANGTAARRRFPHLFEQGRVIGLSVRGHVGAGEDFERGNWAGDMGRWVKDSLAAGVVRPVCYEDRSDERNTVIPELEREFGSPLPPPGPERPFRLLVAIPDGNLDPASIPPEADGKQGWWGSIQAHGAVDYDVSTLRDDFFGPVLSPAPPKPPEGATMLATYHTKDGRVGFVVETQAGEVFHIEQQHPPGDGNSDFWRKQDGSPEWLPLGKPGS